MSVLKGRNLCQRIKFFPFRVNPISEKGCKKGQELSHLGKKVGRNLPGITIPSNTMSLFYFQPKLVNLMGKENFDLYAGKIWQLKFCEDMARIGLPS